MVNIISKIIETLQSSLKNKHKIEEQAVQTKPLKKNIKSTINKETKEEKKKDRILLKEQKLNLLRIKYEKMSLLELKQIKYDKFKIDEYTTPISQDNFFKNLIS